MDSMPLIKQLWGFVKLYSIHNGHYIGYMHPVNSVHNPY